MAFKDRLTEKAGPLPVWGWSLIVGGVIVAVIYYRNKKAAATAASTTDTTSTDTATTDSASAAEAGQIGAAYDVYNELGKLNSTSATLATNVGANTTAINGLPAAITPAVAAGVAKGATENDRYGVVDYGGRVFELGKTSGAILDTAQYQKTGVNTVYTGNPIVEFLGRYYTLGVTGDPGAKVRTEGPAPITAAQAKGRKVTVLSPNTNVNVAPSKVR